jgi:hypothetical protein
VVNKKMRSVEVQMEKVVEKAEEKAEETDETEEESREDEEEKKDGTVMRRCVSARANKTKVLNTTHTGVRGSEQRSSSQG